MRPILLKKGQGMSKTILGVIIILVLMVLFLLLIYNLYQNYAKYIDAKTCKDSIAANALGRIKVHGSDLTNYYGKIVEINCVTKYEKVTSGEDKAMKRKMADAIGECWDLYGKDGYELFDTTDNNYCVICSRLEFEKPHQLGNFSRFLIEEKFEQKTYFEFLYEDSVPPGYSYETLTPQMREFDSINTTRPVGVIFYMTKDAHMGKPVSAFYGAGIGIAVGAALTVTGVFAEVGIPLTATAVASLATASLTTGLAGGTAAGYILGADHSSTFDSAILLYPYDDIKQLDCTYLEGKSHSLEVVQ